MADKKFSKNRIIIIILILLIGGGIIVVTNFYHAGVERVRKTQEQSEIKYEENLEKVNRFLVQKDIEKINSFINRRNWDMEKTGEGLWYMRYEKGKGQPVKDGKYVKFTYDIRLLDGTLCYTSDSLGPKIIKVGSQEEIRGLYEGLKMLREGDKARFIIPPHLAYGLLGDDKKIPKRSIIYYRLSLLEVSDKKIRQ